MKRAFSTLSKYSLLLTAVAVLPGCGFFGSSKDKNESKKTESASSATSDQTTILTINGKSVMNSSDFDKKLAQKLQSSPYTRNIEPAQIPLAAKRKFLDELMRVSLIYDLWGKKNNIENDAEFVKELEEKMQMLKESLVIERFVKDLNEKLEISDAEIRQDYDKNKEKYVKVAGGVLVSGASFKDKEKAQEFLAKAKATPADFATLAKKDKASKFTDFGRVTKEENGMPGTQVPEEIRSAAFASGKTPRVELVSSKDATWVVSVSDKKDSVYFDLDEIKDQLKAMLQGNKFRDELEKRIEALKEGSTVEVNEEYFKEKEFKLPEGIKVVSPEEVKAREEAAKESKDEAKGSANNALTPV